MPTSNPALKKKFNADYYRKHKSAHLTRNRNRKAAVQSWVREYKESHPCTDCGRYFPACVMDFDHLPGQVKTGGVSVLARHTTLPRIIEEVNKCELVCSNCHRIRTWILRELPEGMRSGKTAGRSGPVTP